MAKVSLISLGCPKNLVDSEVALAEIAGAGHEIVVDEAIADVIVVNTCGFVQSAKQESMDAVCGALKRKRDGTCRAVVVIGCLSQRYGPSLKGAGRKTHFDPSELDGVLGVEHTDKLAETIDRALSGQKTFDESDPNVAWTEPQARVLSTPPWTSYIKISEGCSNRCAYCAIPDIRGPFRSRPEDYILSEAQRMAEVGVKEVNLIGQDLTQYGEDSGDPNRLASLVRKLNEVDGLRWIRLMYCYPAKITQELIDAVAECENVVKYLDIPLQHADNDIIMAMNRRGNTEKYAAVIDAIRAKIPDVALRTTFIVGFPGESGAAFERLLGFVERMRFDRVGAFIYSREKGTPAAGFQPVQSRVAQERYDRLMCLQQDISLHRNRTLIGNKLEVLVEGRVENAMYGRSYRDAPEIDGLVYLPNSTAKPGEFVETTIADATEYDLIGT